ncbi:MAG: bifunctional phosphopantothenoylcysteine decarboxylase/phosphopantothenate--cysteine ligase CoaBC [Candidatus Firestonebacteria bacterium]|nr:bifunctional phosphopantothenoylcysteine decarboxylase/phosphopantothenate--cysteine ligase CoaBC [Candidatus Firestonebacteria bacterium]
MCVDNNKQIILLGVTGSIALYKSLEIVRRFIKKNINVQVVMTGNALKFVSPLSFSALSGNNVIIDIFTSNGRIDHIDIAKKASIFLCAPATANLIGKLAAGIADDALTTMALVCTQFKVIAPAMNTAMWNNSIVKRNIKTLIQTGYEVISPCTGELACGEEGSGRMEEPENIVNYCYNLLSNSKKFYGKTILITAGRTEEMIDPVRYISNRSSGRMGYALAKRAKEMGARVILICGVTSVAPPLVDICINVHTAQEMYNTVIEHYKNADIIIKAAAVSDYRPESTHLQKIKKEEKLTVNLIKNSDILAEVGKIKLPSQYLVGFAAETHDVINSAKIKLKEKKLDLIIANDVSVKDIGFDSNNNQITWIDKKGNCKSLPVLSKDEVAEEILNKICGDLLS